jgi:hypothetical protein
MGKGQAKEYVNKLVAKGTKLLHSPETRANVVNVLSKGNPIESVAHLTTSVLQRLDVYAEKTGKKIPDAMKIVVAQNIMGQVVELGQATGFADLDEREQKLAFSETVQSYISTEIKKGRIDPKALADANGEYVANMTDEERISLNDELEDINNIAMESREKYSTRLGAMPVSNGGQANEPMGVLGDNMGGNDYYGA